MTTQAVALELRREDPELRSPEWMVSIHTTHQALNSPFLQPFPSLFLPRRPTATHPELPLHLAGRFKAFLFKFDPARIHRNNLTHVLPSERQQSIVGEVLPISQAGPRFKFKPRLLLQ